MNSIQIKHRITGVVLFEGESGMTMRQVLEQATTAKADLRFAELSFADLRSADLSYANLSFADLSFADLSFANLSSANLRSADLSYANLSGKKLVGERPFFSIGPVGSRSDYIQAWITDSGLMIRAGCFYGTKAEFESKLTDKHGDNIHGNEYRSVLVLIDKHAELWAPVTTKKPEEQA